MKAICINLGKLAFGLTLVVFCALELHTEMERATPSNLRIGLFAVGALLGILICPTIGAAADAAVKRAIQLGALGRRAYDGKLADEVEPPKADPPAGGAP